MDIRCDLQDIAVFHQEIRLVADVGLPLELGLPPRGNLVEQLAEIERQLKRYVESGKPLERFLQSERNSEPSGPGSSDNSASDTSASDLLENGQQVPQRYCDVLLGWLHSGKSLQALEPAVADSVARSELRSAVRLGLVQPIILLLIACVAIAYLLFIQLPGLEAMYDMLAIKRGWAVFFLEVLKAWLPVWLPVLGLVAGTTMYRAWRRLDGIGGASDRRHLSSLVRGAHQAERLVWESDAGLQAVDLKPRAASAVGGALLHWAASAPDPAQRRSSLGFVASVYRSLANRYVAVVRRDFPVYITGLVGGVLVLVVGLGVFGPLIEMLLAFAVYTGK